MSFPISRIYLPFFFVLAVVSCKEEAEAPRTVFPSPEDLSFTLDTVVSGIEIPWGLAVLPDGDLLIGDKFASLYRFDGSMLHSVSGLPPVYVHGQGGLLDIELHPDYADNGWIYFSYAKRSNTASGGNTALMRARLENDELVDVEELFKATPDTESGIHFGSRIEFDPDGYLYLTVGERGNWDNAQTLENHSGKVHRLLDDGSIPADNPFVSQPDAMPSIWSYGHRNPQGLALNPFSGELWLHEHGPMGGDEINVVGKGKNYGWPAITYGINYNGEIISPDTVREGMEQPLHYWDPSIAPSGMTFVTADQYPSLKGHLLIGSLRFTYLHLCMLEGKRVVREYKLLENVGRVRTVREAPDGSIYVGVEGGFIGKLVPAG